MKNVNKILGSFLVGFLAASSALAGEPAQIKPLAGYYLCSDLLNKRFKDSIDFLKAKLTDRDALERLAEMSKMNASLAREYVLADKPDHEVTHPRYRSSGGGVCFAGDTPIVTLKIDESAKAVSRVTTTIYEIDPGEYVLASLAGSTSDVATQVPCWSKVLDIIAGEVRINEEIKTINYHNSAGGAFSVKVTPRHRFFVKNPQNGTWEWVRAEQLQAGGGRLFSCNGNECSIAAATTIRLEKGKPNWLQKIFPFLQADPSELVYNLTTDSNTYYVGSEGGQILVHNVK